MSILEAFVLILMVGRASISMRRCLLEMSLMLSPSAVGYSRLLEWVLRIEQAAGVLSALLSSIQTHVDEQLGRILIMENGKVSR